MTGQAIRAAIVLAVVFGAGLLTGLHVERRQSASPAPESAAAGEHQQILAELRDVLDLDDEQMEIIDRIVTSRQRVVQIHWEQLRPEVQQAMQSVHREIADQLRPDQVARYHEWLSARRARHRRMATDAGSLPHGSVPIGHDPTGLPAQQPAEHPPETNASDRRPAMNRLPSKPDEPPPMRPR